MTSTPRGDVPRSRRAAARAAARPTPEPPVKRVRAALLRWYRRHRRDLPWRRTRDPYAIWVAEVMLQQTQVATVIPYYTRFLERFPDPRRLANAAEEQVLATWSGLGYYRRARALQAGARAIVERHDGQVPSDAESLLALPGVGRYTAGAIASIAFDRPQPVLDGNVRRVLSRLWTVDGRETGPSAEQRRLWELATRLVDGPAPGELNQALMELGALVCRPRLPGCERCPVAGNCGARAAGNPEAYPAARPSREAETVQVAVAWIRDRRGLLVERGGDGAPLRGLWDLPSVELESEASRDDLPAALRARHRIEIELGARVATLSHGIMHRRLRLQVFDARLRRGAVRRNPALRWLDPRSLRDSAVSGATQKIARALLDC